MDNKLKPARSRTSRSAPVVALVMVAFHDIGRETLSLVAHIGNSDC
jgi:hypothetical protein